MQRMIVPQLNRPQLVNRATQYRGGSAPPDEPIVLSSEHMYSRVILYANKDGSNQYTLPAGQLRAFGYGIGDSMASAITVPATGAALARQANLCDTNVVAGTQTNNGAEFIIKGIGCHISPDSDFELVRKVLPEVSVAIVSGSNIIRQLGLVFFLPGGGGLVGTGRQDVSAANSTVSFASNGWAENPNVLAIPEGLVWQPPGSPDSSIALQVTTHNTVVVAGVVASPASAFIKLDFRLYGFSRAPRGRN